MESGPVLVNFQGEVYAGTLLVWRRDRDQNTMKGLVRFSRGGHEAELWFPSSQIRRTDPDDSSVVEEQWSTDAVNRLIESIERDGTDG